MGYRVRGIGVVFCLCSAAMAEHSGSLLGLLPAIPGVIQGRASTVKQVVQILARNATGGLNCSSTIVGEDTLLTAAHCVPPGYEVSVNVSGRDGDSRKLVCKANDKWPYPKPEEVKETDDLRAAVLEACTQMRAGAKTKADVEALQEKLHTALGRTYYTTDDQAASDLAVCKLTEGKFDVPPATIARHDALAGSLEHIGFGCYDFDKEGKPLFPTERQAGTATVVAGTTPDSPLVKTEYKKGDKKKAGICSGDSGGFLGSSVGDKVSIAAVHSSSSSFKRTLDFEACVFRTSLKEEGHGSSVNLFSAESQKFLGEQAANGYKLNGIEPRPGAGADDKKKIADAWKAGGGKIAPDGTPQIEIGKSHPKLTENGIYFIDGKRYRWDGKQFVPVS